MATLTTRRNTSYHPRSSSFSSSSSSPSSCFLLSPPSHPPPPRRRPSSSLLSPTTTTTTRCSTMQSIKHPFMCPSHMMLREGSLSMLNSMKIKDWAKGCKNTHMMLRATCRRDRRRKRAASAVFMVEEDGISLSIIERGRERKRMFSTRLPLLKLLKYSYVGSTLDYKAG